MRHAVQAAWRGALASNWAHEGKGQKELKVGPNYSALGLLCEVHRRMTNEGEWIGYPFIAQTYLGEVTKIPKKVLEWANLEKDEAEALQGKSFAEVKQWLTEPSLFMQWKEQPPLQSLPMLVPNTRSYT